MFITVEGPDGAGKTTLAQALATALTERGRDVLLLREPGGTALGEDLRRLLLDPASSVDPAAEALLYAAARAQLVAEVVRPALEAGRVVVCDLYVESSLAYQGAGRGLGVDAVRAVNEVATGGLRADVVLLVDVTPEVATTRLGTRLDRLEQEGPAFRARVRQGFLQLAEAEPERVVVLDGCAPPDQVLARAMVAVEARWR